MGHRIAYDIGFRQGKPVVVGVADARALTEGTITPAQHEQLRATVTAFLTHADGEPRTLARSHGVRPPLFTYDVLVLLDQQEPADVGDDGMTCPNGNRSPECTEIDPCEACTRDVDVEAQEIERSMGLRALRQGTTDTDPHAPMGVHEVTVSRTELITFTVHAASAPDAEERHLTDGHETASKTVALSPFQLECGSRQLG
ncbi:hypothetical protein AB0A91_34685 [Streptomyces sp. NPDC042207]|uniref:hypothetical protein n=1 Tax=Streptomyces sp. NPDC042207 TaxID=3154331 RepID=UPI0033C4B8A9